MKRSLYVISDLHIGGKIGFQMCSPSGRTKLAKFIQFVAKQKSPDLDVHLVLNGDIVDFLAEEEFSSFSNDNDAARIKLEKIISTSREVWNSLRDYVSSGARLTLMLGNHDLELCLPSARKLLMETIGAGRVEFLYDNQALVEGDVLIEHGNRYDKWNVVSHDALRAIRAAMTRGENPIKYLGPPGSQLVKSVINPIKRSFAFIDLLKPESSGMLPILAVLDPAAMSNVLRLAALAAKSTEARFDENGIPLDHQYIAATTSQIETIDDSLRIALKLAGVDDPQNISAMGEAKGFWERWKSATTEIAKDIQLNLLLTALRHFAKTSRNAFDVGNESPDYLSPAEAAAANGHKVIIYGHTHLAKRVNLDKSGAIYLNTGTWADLMKIPDAVLGDDDALARRQLEIFLNDLEHGKLDVWRAQVPTFARVNFDNETLVEQDIFFFDEPETVTRVPEGQLSLKNYTRIP